MTPNGLCFYKGYWHLFYQSRAQGECICWGHAYSEDCVHWKDLPNALIPGDFEKECWSGSVMVEEDRAITAYYAFDTGIMLAVSYDPLLMKWEKLNGGKPAIPVPVTPEEKAKYYAFDPCVWKKGEKYYLVSGKFRTDSLSGGRERDGYLFESEDLENWKFLHTFLEKDGVAVRGDDLACPYFLPLEDGHVIFHFSHNSGPKYIIGKYDEKNDKFRVAHGESLTSYASFRGGLHAPSAFPESDKALRVIFNTNYCKKYDVLNQIMSLPMTASFTDDDKDRLSFKPVDELASLRIAKSLVKIENLELEANKEHILEGIKGDSSEFVFEFDNTAIPAIEIRVLRSDNAEEYTSVSIYRQRGNVIRKKIKPGFFYGEAHDSVVVLDTLHSSLDGEAVRRAPESIAAYIAPEEKLNIRIFTDKSVVEVFVNDRIMLSSRVYPTRQDSIGVSITPIGRGIKLLSAEGYDLKSIY